MQDRIIITRQMITLFFIDVEIYVIMSFSFILFVLSSNILLRMFV